MKRLYFRSILFNICFVAVTALSCLVFLPMLLVPRRYYMGVVRWFVHSTAFLERVILGLRMEVRGRENLPESGAYIVAAKHQSAYETTKLHILFRDPAVILKKELLSIPIWGWFLKKSDVIAIDRSSRESATKSINEGAARMKEQGRPIIIFPQGTRVAPDAGTDERPYKLGVARIQEATGLTIVPMALNAGVFWPRNGFFKSGGTVVFEFLPPLLPGSDRSMLMAKLEKEIEGASDALEAEALEGHAKKSKAGLFAGFGILTFLVLLVGGYSFYWFEVAKAVKAGYVESLNDLSQGQKTYSAPEVSGFPGKIKLHVAEETFFSDDGTLKLTDLRAESWPLPGVPIDIAIGAFSLRNNRWASALEFDSLHAQISENQNVFTVYESALKSGDFNGQLTGVIDLNQEPVPKLDIVVTLDNHQTLLDKLAAQDIIEDRVALFFGAGLNAMKDKESGVLSLPIYQKGETLMAGPLPLMKLPNLQKSPKRARPSIPAQAAPFSPAPYAADSGSPPAPAP